MKKLSIAGLLIVSALLLIGAASTTTSFFNNISARGIINGTNIFTVPLALTYSSAIAVDFSGSGDRWVVLGGNLTLTSANLAAGRAITYRIDNQTATNCSVILPATWRFVSGTTNNILATGKIGLLSVKSYAANDTNVVCLWSSE